MYVINKELMMLLCSIIGKYTLFAPTNEAFLNIPKWANNIPLKELLSFHVARGLIHSSEIQNDLLVRSILSKRDIRLNIYKVFNYFWTD